MISGTIESIAFGGKGIVRSNGLVIFVPFAAPGDELLIQLTKQKANFAEGEIKEILKPGPSRTPPLCPYFGKCGGCQLQQMTYEAQLETKRRFVQDALQRIAGLRAEVPAVIPSKPWGYRDHIWLRIEAGQPGYTGIDQKTFIPIKKCPIFSEKKGTLFEDIETFCVHFNIQQARLRILKSDERYVLLFDTETRINHRAVEHWLEQHNAYKGIAFLHNDERIEVGDVSLMMELDGLILPLSPYGFLQNQRQLSHDIYHKTISLISSGPVLDLYCGMGATTLLLAAQGKKAIGVESNPASLQHTPQTPNAQFFCGKVEELLPQLIKTHSPQSVILNPPRVGVLPSVLQNLLEASSLRELLYISCMPPTLARDLKMLTHHGYQLTEVHLYDMFPQTTHVETLVKLIRS